MTNLNLLLNKFNELKLDNRKILLIILAVVFMLYLDFAFIMRLQVRAIATLTPKITKLKKDINSLAKDSSALQELARRQSWPGGGKQEGAFKAKEIITEDRILVLLQEISDLANKNNVRVAQINTSKDAKVQEEVVAGERLLPVIITLDLICDYHSLGSFMNALENASWYIDVQDMKITRNSRDYLLESVNLSLRTYAKK